jgi:thioredoxin 2
MDGPIARASDGGTVTQPASQPEPREASTAQKTGQPAVVACAFCRTPNRIDLTRLSQGPKCASCHRPILLDRPLHASEADFDKTLLGTAVPVLVDFYADWCGPCHMMAPTLDDFARRHVGKVITLKLDTDANRSVSGRYGIRGIPTTIVFERGQEKGRHVGVADLKRLEALAGVTSG